MSQTKKVSAKSLTGFSRPNSKGVINTPSLSEKLRVFFYTSIMIGGYWEASACRFLLSGLLTRYSPVTLILVGKLTGFLNQKETIMSNLTILNTEIRTLDNLYSLNDLHNISGKAKKNQPANFIRLDQTQELIAVIIGYPDMGNLDKTSSSDLRNPLKVVRGIGTFASKELVYAYAMWVSPKFHLHVIRSFDALHTQALKINSPQKIKHPLANLPLKDPKMAGCRCVVSYNDKGEMDHNLLPLPESFKFMSGNRLVEDMTQVLQALERIDGYAKLNLFAPVFKASK